MSREKTLESISNDRRGFFRTLMIGAGATAVALPLMTTQSLAQKDGEDPVNGKCDDGLIVSKKTGKCKAIKKAPAQ
ncbi:MAG: hypothetical protein JO256_03660 [Alphaproteobacteria bacterium]|nr:hypothetical protein [Alphaproteobacteria bacterium]